MSEPPRPMNQRRVPLWLLLPALVVLLLAIVWGRVLWGSYQAYQEGVRHLENSALIPAVTYFDRSLHWYTPFNPWVTRSARHLWEIGEKAEQEGDTELALIAYRTIRRGFYAARGVYQPGKPWIRKSEARIETIVGPQESSEIPLPAQEVRDPSVPWSIVVVLGLLGWIGCAVGFVTAQWGPWREREGVLFLRWPWIGGFLFCLAFWLLGMMKA